MTSLVIKVVDFGKGNLALRTVNSFVEDNEETRLVVPKLFLAAIRAFGALERHFFRTFSNSDLRYAQELPFLFPS
jgi:hypothetical protein